MNTIGKWAVLNGYNQCMGCKGFDKSEMMIYRRLNGVVFPYCTHECYEKDLGVE
jgi:hypothetical protein